MKQILAIFVICLFPGLLSASSRQNQTYLNYINKYSAIAVNQQKKYKIPASIILAQGLLESGAGQSRLAKEGNNHFGIKCHDWTGRKMYHDDDRRGECFRKYSSVQQSFDDHSVFLAHRSRYESLFKLRTTDYKGWAHGLKRCGYATDKAYAPKLIKIIEDYDLHKYDKMQGGKFTSGKNLPAWYKPQTVFKNNGIYYVIVRQGDSYGLLEEDLDISMRKIRKYNELPKDYALRVGDIVYLQSKKSKSESQFKFHMVKPGESMHIIAQKYGMKLKNIYKLNDKPKDYRPRVGDILKLN